MASHRARPTLAARQPVLVTTRLCAGLPTLRHPERLAALQRAFAAGADRFGFRLVHFSAQSNHLHLLVEAEDAATLSRGMQGLLVRVARALNRLWGRKGMVFAERYHARILRTPREVRHALVYVLQNCRKHGVFVDGVDPYSSGWWFDGWMELPRARMPLAPGRPKPVVAACSWLLRVGWRRHGLIGFQEAPAAARLSA